MEKESDKIDQGARLQQLIKGLNTTQAGFAQQMNVSQSNINKMVKGVKGVSRTVISGLLLVHKNVNVHWLLTGEGAMFLSDTPHTSLPQPPEPAGDENGGLLYREVEQMVEQHTRAIRELREEVELLKGQLRALQKKAPEKDP